MNMVRHNNSTNSTNSTNNTNNTNNTNDSNQIPYNNLHQSCQNCCTLIDLGGICPGQRPEFNLGWLYCNEQLPIVVNRSVGETSPAPDIVSEIEADA
jgi:hypothetical protein